MIKAIIKINDLNYCGESQETYPCDYAGNGWHTSNHNELNKLKMGNESAKEIFGFRCIRSEIDKIFRRGEFGFINIKKIEIIISEE